MKQQSFTDDNNSHALTGTTKHESLKPSVTSREKFVIVTGN
jgi:hypothetical protein